MTIGPTHGFSSPTPSLVKANFAAVQKRLRMIDFAMQLEWIPGFE
jgi:hypothetical protein